MRYNKLSAGALFTAIAISLLSGCSPYFHQLKTSGYIGFDIARQMDGQYFVSRIDSQAEAWEKGLRQGDRIIGWDQKLISDAIAAYPLRSDFNPSTEEFRNLMACHYISRGKPGSSAEIFYVNKNENSKGVRLLYQEEKQVDYPGFISLISPKEEGDFEYKLLNDSLGYYRINQFTPSALRHFRKKVLSGINNTKGLIIDLRANAEGSDRVAMDIAGHFIGPVGSKYQFKGKVILLAGPVTMGVAEGFINILKDEEQIRVLGSWNTAGSFSLPGGRLGLPKGIQPDIFIPPSKDIIIMMSNGMDVLLAEAINHIWLD